MTIPNIDFGSKKLIVGIGSALVDILAREDDVFLGKIGAAKGGMNLVEQIVIDNAVKLLSDDHIIVPGGSACNTAIGVARLGSPSRFVGKLCDDDFGEIFRNGLNKNGVSPLLLDSPLPTGRVLSVITPDAQRSMLTYLGASSETIPGDVTSDWFDNVAIAHIEGYLLFNPDLMMAILKEAKKHGTKISLDLASFTVVESSIDILEKIVDDYVDILIANEDEAEAFTGFKNEDKAIDALSKLADIAVLKVGKRGSYIAHNGKIIRINPKGSGDAVDTTGAGDLWAAGFLHGLVSGKTLEESGEIGSACGYEVCRVIGASIPDEGWKRITGSF
ncbi:MAG: adenosine kinase [Desulfobacterales bacterium]|nr:adenosine kinase [Desulfobacterales bacterium]